MNRAWLLLAAAPLVIACGAILGLQEPTVDNTIGDAGSDAQAVDASSDVGDAATLTDSGAQQLVNAQVARIAIDDASVFYTEPFDTTVGRIGLDGTGNVALGNSTGATGFHPFFIETNDTDVFWTSSAGLHQCKKAGCNNAPIHIISDSSSYSPYQFVVDGPTIYFLDYDSTNDVSAIRSVPIGAAFGTVSTLVASANICPDVNDLVLSGTYLYFTCDDGRVGRITIADGTVETLSAIGAPPNASELIVESTTLFYLQALDQASLYQMPIVADAASTAIALSQPWPIALRTDTTYLYWANDGASFDNGAGSLIRCSASQCSATTTTLIDKLDVPVDIQFNTSTIYYAAIGNGLSAGAGVWKMPKPP